MNLNEKIGETVPHRPYKKAETERFLCGFRELSTKLYLLRMNVNTFLTGQH